MDQEIVRQQIITAFKSLSKREEIVLRLRFGINDIDTDNDEIHEINNEEE